MGFLGRGNEFTLHQSRGSRSIVSSQRDTGKAPNAERFSCILELPDGLSYILWIREINQNSGHSSIASSLCMQAMKQTIADSAHA